MALLSKVVCPMGCKNAMFSERTKTIQANSNNLLLETGLLSSTKVKVYTCNCCGNSFEMPIRESKNVL